MSNETHREADMTISGVPLTTAQSLTVRVAIQSFAMTLAEFVKTNPGGVEQNYLDRIRELNVLIAKTAK